MNHHGAELEAIQVRCKGFACVWYTIDYQSLARNLDDIKSRVVDKWLDMIMSADRQAFIADARNDPLPDRTKHEDLE